MKKSKSRSWFSIEAKAGDKEADVFIYDDIGGWGITAQNFVTALNEITADQINVRINCRGGDVFEGVAIFNALKRHDAKVVTHTEALAASIASIIALAGDEVEISENAFYMIHNPYSWAVGDAAAMRKAAGMLDKVTDSLINIYTAKTGKSDSEIRDLMDDETWFTADEAKAAGFVDAITDEEIIEAAFDLSVFNNVPKQVFNTLNATKPSTRKLEHALREVGGLSKADAKAVVAKGYNALDHRDDGKGEGHRDDDGKPQNKKGTEESMNKEELKSKHLDTFNAIVTEAQAGLLTEDTVAAKVKAGITAERERIIALDKLSEDMPGHENMIVGFKADGTITAENAALQIIAAHGEKLKGIKAQQESDAAGLDTVPGADGGLGGDGAKGFMALVADHQTEHKCSKGTAIKAITASHPKEHKAYIKEQNKEADDV